MNYLSVPPNQRVYRWTEIVLFKVSNLSSRNYGVKRSRSAIDKPTIVADYNSN